MCSLPLAAMSRTPSTCKPTLRHHRNSACGFWASPHGSSDALPGALTNDSTGVQPFACCITFSQHTSKASAHLTFSSYIVHCFCLLLATNLRAHVTFVTLPCLRHNGSTMSSSSHPYPLNTPVHGAFTYCLLFLQMHAVGLPCSLRKTMPYSFSTTSCLMPSRCSNSMHRANACSAGLSRYLFT